MQRQNGIFKPTKVSLVAILLSSMLILMGGAAVAPALNDIKEYFGADLEFFTSLIITLPSLAVAIVGYAIGIAADKFGKVKILLISLAIFTIAGAIAYIIPDLFAVKDTQLYVILVARFIVGIGIAGITSTVTALIAEYYTGVDRVKVLSYQSAAMGIGVLILEFTGGSLAEISWQMPFLVYLIGIPILILAIISLREPRMSAEDQAEIAEIVKKEKFRKANYRIVALCYVSIFFCMNLVFLLPTSIPIVLADLGVSASIVGLFLGFHGVANAVFSILYRRITTRIPPFKILGIGFLCMGVGLAVLILFPSVPLAIFTLIITGVGVGMIVPSLVNTLAAEVTGSNSGKIMGGYGTCLNFGQFAISLISVPMLAAFGGSASADAYYMMFCVMGVIAIVYGIIIVIGAARYYRRRKEARLAAEAAEAAKA